MTRSTTTLGVSRRGGLMAGIAALASLALSRANAQTPRQELSGDVTPFSDYGVRQLAQGLAERPPRPRAPSVPDGKGLSYDDQRDVRFRADQALWADQTGVKFQAQFFAAVYGGARTVQLFEVHGGQAHPIVFSPQMYGAPDRLQDELADIPGFTGFRLHWPLNGTDQLDEIGAFQGASYFRGLGPKQQYGLSARGLSIRTGETNEEFPVFTAWWLERPKPGADRVVIHALLESDSCTGAYRFQVIPGSPNIYDVEAVIYPRRTIDDGGVAPMSSMFLFGSIDRPDRDDFRSAVHDSDGLAIHTAAGATWRPLSNPRRLQISRYPTESLTGFGLVQRMRTFDDYGDLEARYDRRPSLWIEPLDAWGPGAVHLVEIPTRQETDDNIACFWRPDRPWSAGAPVSLRYRLTWGEGPPSTGLAQVMRTRSGVEGPPGVRLYTIDFADVGDIESVERDVTADAGSIEWSSIQPHATPGAARVAFGFKPFAASAELSVRLLRGGTPISETWRYRWSAG